MGRLTDPVVRTTVGVRYQHVVDVVPCRRSRLGEQPGQVGDILERSLKVFNALDNGLDVVLVAKVGYGRDDSTEVALDCHSATGGCTATEILANGDGL